MAIGNMMVSKNPIAQKIVSARVNLKTNGSSAATQKLTRPTLPRKSAANTVDNEIGHT